MPPYATRSSPAATGSQLSSPEGPYGADPQICCGVNGQSTKAWLVDLDLVGGVSGDMFIAALVDAWPALATPVLRTIRNSGLPQGSKVSLVQRCSGGLAAAGFVFEGSAAAPERRVPRSSPKALRGAALCIEFATTLSASWRCWPRQKQRYIVLRSKKIHFMNWRIGTPWPTSSVRPPSSIFSGGGALDSPAAAARSWTRCAQPRAFAGAGPGHASSARRLRIPRHGWRAGGEVTPTRAAILRYLNPGNSRRRRIRPEN